MNTLLTVSELSSLRWLLEMKCSTEQGIRGQIKELENGVKQPNDVGFKVERPTKSIVLLRLVDENLEQFRAKLVDWVEKNKPK